MKQKTYIFIQNNSKIFLKFFWKIFIMIKKKQSWLQSILVYKDLRMLKILLLGAISGFPWVLIASSLSLWLKRRRIK